MTAYTTEMFVQDLRDTVSTSHALIGGRVHMTREQMIEHIDNARATTGDSMTDLIAVNVCCALVGALGIVPRTDMVHGFTVQTAEDGTPVEADQAPAGLTARSRIVVALANTDPGAARDVWTAFRTTHPDQVTGFIADTIDTVHEVATRRGMRVGCPHCG
jgi:hypothetical protein